MSTLLKWLWYVRSTRVTVTFIEEKRVTETERDKQPSASQYRLRPSHHYLYNITILCLETPPTSNLAQLFHLISVIHILMVEFHCQDQECLQTTKS